MNKKENMNNSKSNTLIVIAIFMMVIAFFAVYFGKTQPNIDKVDTVFNTRVDTLRDTLTFFKEKPVPKYIYQTKVDTFYTKEGNDTLLKTENKIYKDTLCQQKDTAIVTSYITGINASLDSTKIQLNKTKEIITNTVEITKYLEKKKTFFDRFHLGIQTGIGYGLVNKKPDVYIGAGVSFDL